MSGTSLYRALIHAGAPEAEAREAAAEMDTLGKDMSELKLMVAETRIMARILVGLAIAIFLMLPQTML